jgi:hypothetical protein
MLAAQGHDKRHCGVEMAAGDGTERKDQHHQNRAGRQRVAEQGKSYVPARQLFAHDARADNRCHEQPGAKAFGRKAFGEREGRADSTVAYACQSRDLRPAL